MKVFNKYASYYDLLYQDKNYKIEADYVNKLLSDAPVAKHRKILELGCGTGKHAIALAEIGYSVDGIDISNKMIKMANSKLKSLPTKITSKLHFGQGDIRTYKGKKKYDVAISLFHIISYMSTNEDLLSMLKTANTHLKKDGVFIFDCWYGPSVLTDRPTVRIKELENEELKIKRLATPTMHPNDNTVDVEYNVTIIEKGTHKKEVINEVHTMRYLFEPEIKMFLKNSGFKLISSQEWLTGKKPGFDTWGVCFIAKKYV